MDKCYNSPCKNNGTCHNLADNYTCTCPAKFTGRNCEGWFWTCRKKIAHEMQKLYLETLLYPFAASYTTLKMTIQEMF